MSVASQINAYRKGLGKINVAAKAVDGAVQNAKATAIGAKTRSAVAAAKPNTTPIATQSMGTVGSMAGWGGRVKPARVAPEGSGYLAGNPRSAKSMNIPRATITGIAPRQQPSLVNKDYGLGGISPTAQRLIESGRIFS